MEPFHVFVYCNPSSGGNKARELLHLPIQKTNFAYEDQNLNYNIQVRIYDLKTKESREEGFKELFEFKKTGAKIRAVAAGGDGTVKWVISELVKIECIDIAIGVIPFGTGNDLARVLGWGSTAPDPLIGGADMHALKDIISALASGEEVTFDVWQVTTKVNEETGRIEIVHKEEGIIERPDQKKALVEHMINYCSFGQDARAVFGFERHRRQSQFLNKVQFALEGGKLSMNGRKLTGASIQIGKNLDEKVSDDFNIATLQGIIFQNIPSYAAGSDFWDAKERWTPGDVYTHQHVGDSNFEVHGLKRVIDIGLHKATLGTRDATVRLAQTSRMHLSFGDTQKHPVYMQIDGEPARLVDPEFCEIEPGFRAKMVFKNVTKTLLLKKFGKNVIIHSGYVLKARKRLERDSWNSRFLVILEKKEGKRYLEWYLNEQQRGSIEILKDGKLNEHIEVSKYDHDGPRQNTCFSVKYRHRTFHFSCLDQNERDAWLNAIGYEKNTADG